MKFSLFFLINLFIISSAFASNCYKYKVSPNVDLSIPKWKKEIVLDSDMDMYHGNVVAQLQENYELGIEQIKIENGYCIVLSDVFAVVGYDNFKVKINSSNEKNSCEYDAILKHEDKHIETYLSVISEKQDDIYDTIKSSAQNVIPVFIESELDIDFAMDKIHNMLSSYPELRLLIKQIFAAQELQNKELDYSGKYNYLDDCDKKMDKK